VGSPDHPVDIADPVKIIAHAGNHGPFGTKIF